MLKNSTEHAEPLFIPFLKMVNQSNNGLLNDIPEHHYIFHYPKMQLPFFASVFPFEVFLFPFGFHSEELLGLPETVRIEQIKRNNFCVING